VGGGPAGLSAAEEAARAGAEVLLLDRQSRLGGHLLYDGVLSPEIEATIAALGHNSRVRILSGTSAFGLYEGNLLGAFRGDRFLKIRAQQIIVCTGGRQPPVLFHNNDLPGIMTLAGVLRLARLHGVRAGRRVVVLAPSDHDS